MNTSDNLEKPIEIRTNPRPIKVAYIVPSSETEENQMILDAVFFESYTRWGGARTLIIPSTQERFCNDEYEDWLYFLDPDFVYSYVELDTSLIKKIDDICSPISLISHKSITPLNKYCWRKFLPEWDNHYEDIYPVSSLSTLPTHSASWDSEYAHTFDRRRALITLYDNRSLERFISDNFGTQWRKYNPCNPINGLFETFCFTKEDVPENMNIGTHRVSNISEILSIITSSKATTFSQLARIHNDSYNADLDISLTQRNFIIFIGESCLDRISFWNTRNLAPSWYDTTISIILKKENLDEKDFLIEMGRFLDKYAHIENDQGTIQIKSLSEDIQTMELAKDKLKNSTTWKRVDINSETFNKQIFPKFEKEDHKFMPNQKTVRWTALKVSNKNIQVKTEEPYHFRFTPPRHHHINVGQWSIDLNIERHDAHTDYINDIDSWLIPRRNTACNAFTQHFSKVNKHHLLSLIPEEKKEDKDSYFNISLPSDETIFKHLLLGTDIRRDPLDLRTRIESNQYEDLSLSDKGENLRGILAMFESLENCCNILTNKLWREVLSNIFNKKTGWNNFVSYEQINGCISRDKNGYKKSLKDEFSFKSDKEVNKYITAALDDALEYLVRIDIFHQVHKWRCHHCGYHNARSIDEIKKVNECNICRRIYYAPLNPTWHYKVNNFVIEVLYERSGLSVLYALKHLHQGGMFGFCFLPEVDLFLEFLDSESKEEIDILCMREGEFYIVEAKKTATGFLKEVEIDKLKQKIMKLKPDIALLSFERYSNNEEEIGAYKMEIQSTIQEIKSQLNMPSLIIKAIVASDDESFENYTPDFGFRGSRTMNALYNS